jgi:hypothetical protein
MSLRFIKATPEIMGKLQELKNGQYRPPEIRELDEMIEGKKRLAAFRFSITGIMDTGLIQDIVELKLRKDAAYGDWLMREMGER